VTSLPDPPADPGSLRGFPARELPAGTALARIHRRRHGPLWFRHDGEGRFDLAPPRGTLYAAAEPLGCYVEVFLHLRLVPREEIDARHLSTLAPRRALRLADCAAAQARAFGLTGALHTTPAFDETQVWAAAFAAAGFDGVRYLVRHDPAQRLVGYALFAAAGAAAPGAAVVGTAAPGTAATSADDWEVTGSAPIPDELLRQVEDRFGLSVLPTDTL
jgi:hypothetical protein